MENSEKTPEHPETKQAETAMSKFWAGIEQKVADSIVPSPEEAAKKWWDGLKERDDLEDVNDQANPVAEKIDNNINLDDLERKGNDTESIDPWTFEGEEDNVAKTEKSDDNGKVYTDANGKLLPNTEYVLNGNVYKTDEKGRIISCESTPKKTPENPRDNDAQAKAGGEDRKSSDQGGHIVSRDMGGDEGLGNLIPLDARINQSDYRRMENDIKKALDEGKDVKTKTEIIYDGDSDRPSKIITTVTVDGKDTVYTFDNNMDGSLMDKIKETCSESDLKTVQDILDETGGQISSVKEEYDADGNLVKTTVSITYTGEDGKNYRKQVTINNNGGAV